jgi:hypothetical protein
MRGLNLLVEMARRTIDERRASLGEISRTKAECDQALTDLITSQQNEIQIGTIDPAVLVTLDAWAQAMARRRAGLRQRNAELDQKEAAAREALRSAFLDMKRLEIVHDTVELRERTSDRRRADIQAQEAFTTAQAHAAA